MWVLGIELKSSGLVVSECIYPRTISPAFFFFETKISRSPRCPQTGDVIENDLELLSSSIPLENAGDFGLQVSWHCAYSMHKPRVPFPALSKLRLVAPARDPSTQEVGVGGCFGFVC